MQFPIEKDLEQAMHGARRGPRDAIGNLHHTFRIELPADDPGGQRLISRLVDQGWQIQGAPMVIDTVGSTADHDPVPRHLLISMLHCEPRPLEWRGELHGEVRGESRLR